MCKPTLRHLPIHFDGPCGFRVSSFADACAAFSLGTSWRQRAANTMRRWADHLTGERTFIISAYGPPQMVHEDTCDAVTVGMNAAGKYLNDLWRDRVFGSKSSEVGQIQHVRAIR